jgi:hypothetical protein
VDFKKHRKKFVCNLFHFCLFIGWIFFFPEKIEVPILKKRREVLPVDVTTPTDVCADSTVAKEVSSLSPQKEETQPCPPNLENDGLQLEKSASREKPVVSLSPHKNLPPDTQPKKEEKSVWLIDIPTDAEALRERGGDPPSSPRSVSSLPHPSPRELCHLFLYLFS